MRKLLIAVVIAVILIAAFTAPVFADQPADPGVFGTDWVKDAAQNDVGGLVGPGASPEIKHGQELAGEDSNLGQLLKVTKEGLGIPPGHTP